MRLWLAVTFLAIAAAMKMNDIEDGKASEEEDEAIASLVDVVSQSLREPDGSASGLEQATERSVPGPGLEQATERSVPGPGPLPTEQGLSPKPAAPGPAPGPAAAPEPEAAVAASPFGAEEEQPAEKLERPAEKPDLTKRLLGVDYSLLSANAKLRTSFESAVKAVLAAQVQGGMEPKDVTLWLSPGSVIIDAWFANPESLSALKTEKLRETLCHNANLDSELLEVVSNMPGFKDVTTGDVHLEKAPQCASKDSQTGTKVEKPRQQEHKVAPFNVNGSSNCNPPCLEGRGICGGDNICFCEHPYTGVQCEKEVEEMTARISWVHVVMMLCAIVWFGLLLGECLWNICKQREEYDKVPKRIPHEVERWNPSTWMSVKAPEHVGH